MIPLAILFAAAGAAFANQPGEPLPEPVMKAYEKARKTFPKRDSKPVLVVRVSEQRLFHFDADGKRVAVYPVSTSKFGTGSTANSNKTPLGTHEVREKYGEGAPKGTIFRARGNSGKIAEIHTDKTDVEEDLITSRILWLAGLEPGVNQGKGIDSYKRYIYIHGTPEEGLIGEPASHGCVRMKNDDVIELFDSVPEGTLVEIVE